MTAIVVIRNEGQSRRRWMANTIATVAGCRKSEGSQHKQTTGAVSTTYRYRRPHEEEILCTSQPSIRDQFRFGTAEFAVVGGESHHHRVAIVRSHSFTQEDKIEGWLITLLSFKFYL
jgi:hypothetical protein